ncbi:carbon-nitrogen hydrolase family protein [Corynebacterium cystitidis]|uniref:Predicted amidohydrolase n=1 Tax=Corynebacterium cystitidis DSM 20524 TaxID=1121357 RepID=A0A1H9T415_9CORY|nr:carbon-nitrogen hydrolase family protein [Corynebacterium cystitidis]WJY83452.1 (R)-stereoselective amidase [Corynebacterium cystitidis DSM 20524]SER92000.1 Predicted amidohydrolase [Corynebacterium cystitidis DSM 20524]SNV61345.1 carbon-nitrogen hydrolase [Corynebacterium cystitidis]
MKIGLVQITTAGDKMSNFRHAEESIRRVAADGAELIVCPEATSQAFGQGRLDTQAEQLDGEFSQAMASLADELGVVIVAGMFRPADVVDDKNRVYNTALITGGGHHFGYDKINTYDAFDYSESDTVKPGEDLVIFDHKGVNVGVAICFDIRFPDLFQELARAGAEVIVVPTSWADGDGKLEQWRIVTSARALDSTAFIAAAGQARPGGDAKAGQASGPTGLGHSTVVNPFGQRVAELGYGEDNAVVEIDTELVAKARQALPIL